MTEQDAATGQNAPTASDASPGSAPGEQARQGVLVVALDGSPASVRALDFALDHASGSPVVAVYVIKRYTISGDLIGASAAMDQAADELRAELATLVESHARDAAVSARLEVRRGSVLKELVSAADDLGARTVLVGASGHRLIGALAPKIVHTGRWPVTVVP